MSINWTDFLFAWDNAPGTAMIRNPPATDEAIAAAEARLGIELPVDFAALGPPDGSESDLEESRFEQAWRCLRVDERLHEQTLEVASASPHPRVRLEAAATRVYGLAACENPVARDEAFLKLREALAAVSDAPPRLTRVVEQAESWHRHRDDLRNQQEERRGES